MMGVVSAPCTISATLGMDGSQRVVSWKALTERFMATPYIPGIFPLIPARREAPPCSSWTKTETITGQSVFFPPELTTSDQKANWQKVVPLLSTARLLGVVFQPTARSSG